jgi:hypothetical protein
MAVMIHRTTLTLDENTIRRIKILAGLWNVSKAEAVRRAVEQAERKASEEKSAPIKRLQDYHRRGGLDSQTAESYLREARENRGIWRGEK